MTRNWSSTYSIVAPYRRPFSGTCIACRHASNQAPGTFVLSWFSMYDDEYETTHRSSMLLITGAAGFIGGNFVHHWVDRCASGEDVVVFDKLTYAGNPLTIQKHLDSGRAQLVHADVADREAVRAALVHFQPRAVLHFAAESHVDRSILGPAEFIHTNVVGTFSLLEEVRAYWGGLSDTQQEAFRFLHVSTDEVYGSLGPHDPAFS